MVALPPIRSLRGGNVEISLPDGVTVTVPDVESEPTNIVAVDDASFELVKHLLEIIASAGLTLGEAAADPAVQARLANFEITKSSRVEI